jgi:hypothetical protein
VTVEDSAPDHRAFAASKKALHASERPVRTQPWSPLRFVVTASLLVATASSCGRSPPPEASTGSRSGGDPSTVTVEPSPVTATPSPRSSDPSTPPNPWLPPTAKPDLPASIASTLAAVSSTDGGKPFPHTVVGSFVILDADGGSRYAVAVNLATRAVPLLFDGRFQERPSLAVPVLVFSDQSRYFAFCNDRHDGACPSPFGEYSRSRREIVMHATPGMAG